MSDDEYQRYRQEQTQKESSGQARMNTELILEKVQYPSDKHVHQKSGDKNYQQEFDEYRTMPLPAAMMPRFHFRLL
jgi:hypothetical protein